jgi:hypothetical protein
VGTEPCRDPCGVPTPRSGARVEGTQNLKPIWNDSWFVILGSFHPSRGRHPGRVGTPLNTGLLLSFVFVAVLSGNHRRPSDFGATPM